VDAAVAGDVGRYTLQSYTYLYSSAYGSDEILPQQHEIQTALVSPDGLSVRLKVAGLRPLHVHELALSGFISEDGLPLDHPRAYYTLNRIPSK
jgi:hypothetical protein